MFKTFASTYFKNRGRINNAYQKTRGNNPTITALENVFYYHPKRIRVKVIEGFLRAGIRGEIPEIIYVSHHIRHAYSTYFCSGFKRAGILTIDGSGENICTQLAVAEGDAVRVVESHPIPNSLGWFYAAITEYLGFIPYRDEGKLMGLAAYGEARKDRNKWVVPFSKILTIGNGTYDVDPIYTHWGGALLRQSIY